MAIQEAFRYELMPDGAFSQAFIRFAGAKRHVWNTALKLFQYPGYNKTASHLLEWKEDKP